MRRPVFKAHLHVSIIRGEGVLLLSETEAWALHGKVYELLAPLLDGSRGMDEIVDTLAGQIDPTLVYYALAQLEKKGHIAESVPEVSNDTAAFWHGLEIEPRAAIEILRTRRVRVRAIGRTDAAWLEIALADFGMGLAKGEAADFEVVLTDDYLRPELDALNTALLRAVRPWLLVKPVGHELWLGPLFVPGKTGCYRCLAGRLTRSRRVHRFAAEKDNLAGLPTTARASAPATISATCQLAAVEVAKFMTGAKEGLQGKLLSLDVRTWRVLGHDLMRQPACTACGDPTPARPRPIELVSRLATSVRDCGHRTRDPDQTLKDYQHLVSPLIGVVTALVPVHRSSGPVNLYAAGYNGAFEVDGLTSLKTCLRSVSGGKGISEVQAKTSALCEAIERYSGERTGAESILTASFREIRERFGTDAIHPNDVMRYSDRQFAERKAWNDRKSRFNQVPEVLDESVPIDWTPVWSLTHLRHKYLPTQFLYYSSKASAACETYYCTGCSNGNAAGNNLEEAVLQGLCELVERDAVALWWYNRLRKPGVSWETFGEPYFIDLVRHYQTLGRETWALDLTSDLGIPAFAAVSRRPAAPEERILFGLGCHLDPRIALQRAFAEMNQMLSLAQDDESKLVIGDSETLCWLKTSTLASQPYMAPDGTIPNKRREDYTSLCTGDLLEDIRLCRRIVEDRGMEVLVLDQTRPDVNMPVVKVIVPGLRHFWARFAPGRLYDIPVQMGWQKRPLAEEELNPIPIFF